MGTKSLSLRLQTHHCSRRTWPPSSLLRKAKSPTRWPFNGLSPEYSIFRPQKSSSCHWVGCCEHRAHTWDAWRCMSELQGIVIHCNYVHCNIAAIAQSDLIFLSCPINFNP